MKKILYLFILMSLLVGLCLPFAQPVFADTLTVYGSTSDGYIFLAGATYNEAWTGAPIATFLTAAGTLFGGIGGKDFGGILLIFLWFAAALAAGTGHFAGGAIASLFFVGIGMLFGLIPWALILCVALLGAPFYIGWYREKTLGE